MSIDNYLIPDGLNPRTKKSRKYNGVNVSTVPGTSLNANVFSESSRMVREDAVAVSFVDMDYPLALVVYAEVGTYQKFASELRGHARRHELAASGPETPVVKIYAACDKYHCGAGTIIPQPNSDNKDIVVQNRWMFDPPFYAVGNLAPPVGSTIEVAYLAEGPYSSGIWRFGNSMAPAYSINSDSSLSLKPSYALISPDISQNYIMEPKKKENQFLIFLDDDPLHVQQAKIEYNAWTGRKFDRHTWPTIAKYFRSIGSNALAREIEAGKKYRTEDKEGKKPHFSAAFIQYCLRDDLFFQQLDPRIVGTGPDALVRNKVHINAPKDTKITNSIRGKGNHIRYFLGSLANTDRLLEGETLQRGEWIYIPTDNDLKKFPRNFKSSAARRVAFELYEKIINKMKGKQFNFKNPSIKYRKGAIVQKNTDFSEEDENPRLRIHGDIATDDQGVVEKTENEGKHFPDDYRSWVRARLKKGKKLRETLRIGGNVGDGRVNVQKDEHPGIGFSTNNPQTIEEFKELIFGSKSPSLSPQSEQSSETAPTPAAPGGGGY